MHENNVRFALSLLERIFFELRDAVEESKRAHVVEQIPLLVTLIGHAAQRHQDFLFLHTNSLALELIVGVLEAVC